MVSAFQETPGTVNKLGSPVKSKSMASHSLPIIRFPGSLFAVFGLDHCEIADTPQIRPHKLPGNRIRSYFERVTSRLFPENARLFQILSGSNTIAIAWMIVPNRLVTEL